MSNLFKLGAGIGYMERGRDLAAIASTSLALDEQIAKVSKEIDTLHRMSVQHAIDTGVGNALSTRAALRNGTHSTRDA